MIPRLAGLLSSFILIGAGAYGGGLATIPLIQHELVLNRHWLAFGEMTRLLAVAQMTPGPIAVNAATFVGFHVAGLIGAMVATCSVVLPSISILIVAAPFIDRVSGNLHVQRLRHGLQQGVVSLILFAVWSYGTAVITGWNDFALGAGAFAVLVATEGRLHPVIVILACGIAGLVLF